MFSYQWKNSHSKDKPVSWASYLYNSNGSICRYLYQSAARGRISLVLLLTKQEYSGMTQQIAWLLMEGLCHPISTQGTDYAQLKALPWGKISMTCTTLVLRNDRKCKYIFIFPSINSSWQRVNWLGPSNTIWWHRSWSALAQVIACCLMEPSHFLNQLLNTGSGVLWYSHGMNFMVSAKPTILDNEFENDTFKITATSPRWQWVMISHGLVHPVNHATEDLTCCYVQDVYLKDTITRTPTKTKRTCFHLAPLPSQLVNEPTSLHAAHTASQTSHIWREIRQTNRKKPWNKNETKRGYILRGI